MCLCSHTTTTVFPCQAGLASNAAAASCVRWLSALSKGSALLRQHREQGDRPIPGRGGWRGELERMQGDGEEGDRLFAEQRLGGVAAEIGGCERIARA